jgi:tetraacyldisaccharide 4'-kinase
MHAIEHLWFSPGVVPSVARAALSPFSATYAAVMSVRHALYDSGALPSASPGLPVVSIGNLTVGGTGKTPVAAWVAGQLRARARPAILLRGYGGDEVHVHARLNPGIPVVANADRVAGVRQALAQGADVVVADDAFQHRQLRRTADVVLVSVEQLLRPRRLLPAGPWREPLDSARRADLVILTRKSASRTDADRAADEVRGLTRRPVVLVELAPDAVVRASDNASEPLGILRGRAVLAIAAIGEPDAFARQLELLGADVTLARFRDHHGFTAADVATLAARVPAGGLVVCTLKDAVKLAALWPPSSPLWYVSQRLVVEDGAEHLNELLDRVLAARPGTTTTAG